MSQSKSWRDILPVHPAADLFPPMSKAELRELGDNIKNNGLRVPVVLLDNGDNRCLLDGRNRLDAMEAAGIPVFSKKRGDTVWSFQITHVHESGDPYQLVLSLNIRRRHLTAEQKRELIAKVLKAKPEKSDRQIAETIKASPTTVGKVRAELENESQLSTVDSRTGKDGKARKRPAKKNRKNKTSARAAITEGTPDGKIFERDIQVLGQTNGIVKGSALLKEMPEEQRAALLTYFMWLSGPGAIKDVAEKDKRIAELEEKLKEKEARIADLEQQLNILCARDFEKRHSKGKAAPKSEGDGMDIPACLRRVTVATTS